MDITPYVVSLRHDLAAAAERLALALDPAMRLALMDALSQAAAEITAELAEGSVEVRLRGREPELVVDVPAPPTPPPSAATTTADTREPDDGDDSQARITLRLPESVKSRAEELAALRGSSLNTWIVAAIRTATSDRQATDHGPDHGPDRGAGRGGRTRGDKRLTGWV